MILGLKFVKNLAKIALFIDQVARSQNSVELPPHELLRSPGTISIGYGMIFIAEQLEIERVALYKLG